MHNKYKRRNFFIKKNFQGKLILGYFLFVLAGCLLFALLLAAFSADTLTVAYQNNDLQLGRTPEMLLKNTLAAFLIFMLAGGSLVVLFALFITHRMAGPMYRLEQTLDQMKQGNLTDTIRLRKKDAGKEIAAKLNDFNRQLSSQVQTIDSNAREIENLVSEYLQPGRQQTDQEAHRLLLKEIKARNQTILKVTTSFALADE
jgi:methyl-accepting chemotaxis protein